MKTLEIKDLNHNPIEQFSLWFNEAKSHPAINDPNAFCLSTIDPDGYPNARMVLLKDHGEDGFLFFSNCNSTKGQALEKTPLASMTFFWDALHRQVRIQGSIVVISDAEADSYFKLRERAHQIGSVASLQSEVMESRKILDQRIKEIEERFRNQEIPRPEYWLGYRIVPKRIEFWQRREDSARMNDRYVYLRGSNKNWAIKALYP